MERDTIQILNSDVPQDDYSPLRSVEQEIGNILESLAQTLSTSCVYFTPGNTDKLPPPPDLLPMLEEMDGRVRGMLTHVEWRAPREERRRRLIENLSDLYGAYGGVRTAARYFRLLREIRTPPSGIAPLHRITDEVVILLHATAGALINEYKGPARAAMRAYIAVRQQSIAVQAIITDLATFLPYPMWRLIQGAVTALMVAAQCVSRIAYRFVHPNLKAANMATSANRLEKPAGTLALSAPECSRSRAVSRSMTMPTRSKVGALQKILSRLGIVFRWSKGSPGETVRRDK